VKLILIDLAYVVVLGLIGYFAPLPIPGNPLVFALLLGAASFRGGRAIAYNLVGKPLRNALGVFAAPDGSGAGDSSHIVGGDDNVLGNLVSCPICSGTLVAAVLFGIYRLLPGVGAAYVYVLAAAGLAEALHWVSQVAEWAGHKQRYEVGWYVMANEKDKLTARQKALEAYEASLGEEIAFGFIEPIKTEPYRDYIKKLNELEKEGMNDGK